MAGNPGSDLGRSRWSEPGRRYRALAIALVGVLAAVGVEWIALLILNSGHLAFTLDDAYIHLALAENLSRGHYGMNAGEYSSPSSSILWPFLLVPFARSGSGHLAPLFLNIVFAVGTVFLFWKLVTVILHDPEGRGATSTGLITLLVLLLVVATNLIGLIFTGMEHSLQLFLVVLVVWGLIHEIQRGRVSQWLRLALVLAPLVRYECLAVSMPALLFLFLRGHRKVASLTAASLVALVGAFSAFLLHLGLGPLPSSTLAKSRVLSAGGSGPALIRQFRGALNNPRGSLLVVAMLVLSYLAWSGGRERGERALAGCVAASVALHLAVGEYGWYSRYEIYIWTTAALILLYLFRRDLPRILARDGPFRAGAFAVLALLLTCSPHIGVLVTNAIASNNIYEQQYQMHRFVTEFYKRPVAVNDVGYVSYRNDHYVLDVVGLGSPGAREAWKKNDTAAWLGRMSQGHDVRLAMIYENWFTPISEQWEKVGDLHLGRERITVNQSVVGFYARDADTREEAVRLLHAFQPTLPTGVRFTFADSG